MKHIIIILSLGVFNLVYAASTYNAVNQPNIDKNSFVWSCPDVKDISFSTSENLWSAGFKTKQFSPQKAQFIAFDFQGQNPNDKPIKFKKMSIYTLQSPANDFTCSYETSLNNTMTFILSPDALLVGGNQMNKEVVCGLDSQPTFSDPHTETSTNKKSVVICRLM